MSNISEELLNKYIETVNKLGESYNSLVNLINSHSENTSIHFDTGKEELINSRLNEIESFINKLGNIPIERMNTLTETDIDNIKILANNRSLIENMIKYQEAIYDYILERTSSEETIKIIDEIKANDNLKQFSLNLFKVYCHETNTSVPSYTHPLYHEPYDIKQNDNYRFVSTEQIDRWNNAVVELENIKDKINYTNDTNIINLKNIPLATKDNPGLLSTSDYNRLHKIYDNDVKPDWNVTDSNDPRSIDNKPESLPADGGDSNTVGGYSADYILSKDKMSYTIGSSTNGGNYDYDINSTDFLNILKNISKSNNSDSRRYIDLATYKYIIILEEDATLENLVIDGHDSEIEVVSSSARLHFNNCVLKNIKFTTNTANSITLNDNNVVSDCTFIDVNIIVKGNENDISRNIIKYSNVTEDKVAIVTTALYLESDDNVKCEYNIVSFNRFYGCGIKLTGDTTNSSVRANMITNNYMRSSIYLEGNNINSNFIVDNIAPRVYLKNGFMNYIRNLCGVIADNKKLETINDIRR